MQNLTLFMLLVVTTTEFLAKGDHWGRWAILPQGVTYLPELLGMAAAAYVVFAGVRSRFQFVRPQYWLVFAILIVGIACGIAVNRVEAGPIFAGLRNYMRAIPWFFVAAVYAYSQRQVQTQIRWLFAIALVQVPLAVQQRMSTAATDRFTGDWTSGTLLISSVLSIFLISAINVAAALYVRGHLRRSQFLGIFAVLLLPTLINETKGTLVLLPVSLIVTFLIAAKPTQRMRYGFTALAVVALAAAAYVPVYDALIEGRKNAVPLTEFLQDRERLETYLSRSEDIGDLDAKVGKLDAITVPLRRLAEDPATLVFGLGIGNVSHSSLGHGFVGRHNALFGPFLTTAFARIVLELGLLGIGCVLILMWMIFRDAWRLAHSDTGLIGAFGAGWAGVTVVIAVSIVYKDLTVFTSLSFVFWYMSGLVAAARIRQVLTGGAPAPVKLPSR